MFYAAARQFDYYALEIWKGMIIKAPYQKIGAENVRKDVFYDKNWAEFGTSRIFLYRLLVLWLFCNGEASVLSSKIRYYSGLFLLFIWPILWFLFVIDFCMSGEETLQNILGCLKSRTSFVDYLGIVFHRYTARTDWNPPFSTQNLVLHVEVGLKLGNFPTCY